MNTSRHFNATLPFLFLGGVFLIMLSNVFYSWGWTDEAFYLSTIHRMYCGDRLFLDEWSPTQTYAPLLYPFYALYLKINGNADGIYLFFRILTLVFQTATACISYRILSKKHGKCVALAFASLLIIFARAGISGPSYYTFCLMNFSLGTLLIYAVFENKSAKQLMFAAGIFLALAVLCNPYLAMPYVVLSAAVLLVSKTRKSWRLFLLCWLGTAISAVVYTILFIPFDSFDDFLRSLHYIFNDPAYGRTPILIFKSLIKCPRLLTFPYVLTYSPMIAALVITEKKGIRNTKKTHFFLFALNTGLLVINIFAVRRGVESPVMALSFYTLLALISSHGFRPSVWLTAYRAEILYGIIPGLTLSYFFCLASDTGFGVCAIGMCFASFALFSILRDCYGSRRFFIIPMFAVLASTLFLRINTTYRDSPLPFHLIFVPSMSKNAERITEGSAKGLYTSKENKAQYDLVLDTIRALPCKDGDGLLVSQLIPWIFLERQELRCAAPTTWRLFLNDYRLEPYFTDFSGHHFPEFVLVIDGSIIRDNNRANKNNEESWLFDQLEQRYYIQKQVPCGIFYMKSQ